MTLPIPALDCAEELRVIERSLRPLPGILELVPNYLQRTLHVQFDPGQIDAQQIAAAITSAGFPVAPPPTSTAPTVAPAVPVGRAWATRIGGLLLLVAAAFYSLGISPTIVTLCLLASTAASGLYVAQAALRAIRLRTLDMNALMTLAATGGLATGHGFESATAMFLFGVSLWIESHSFDRARRAVESLVALTPKLAHRLIDGRTEFIDPAAIASGDAVRVLPGERIPVDGRVLAGQSSVNQALITGESAPVTKQAGDHVFAGSLNGEGSLDVQATSSAADSTLAHIARLVQQAQANRSPTERFVDRFARSYTPAVIALAIAVAAGPPLLAAAGWTVAPQVAPREWLYRGLVLLVIACPCALVISTPVTIVCGLFQAARRGLLIKGGVHLERAAQIQALAFDKTGTLTTGTPELAEVLPAPGVAADELLRVAAALELHSEHPLAGAIVRAAAARGIKPPPVTEFAALRGLGVRGHIDGQLALVGSPRLMAEMSAAVPQLQDSTDEDSPEAPGTRVLVTWGENFLGELQLAETVRPDAATALTSLRALGIGPICLLTGDHPAAAQRIADQLNIRDWRAELLPADKLAAVRHLADMLPHLAVVGDGVNDAPALAAAPLGIAFGVQASESALETADIVVLSPRLERLVVLVQLGRRTRRLLWQNIALSLGIKLVVMLLAAAGAASMWLAVAADVGASLLVVANGSRLLRWQAGEDAPSVGDAAGAAPSP